LLKRIYASVISKMAVP